VDFLSAKTQFKAKALDGPDIKAKALQPLFVRSDAYIFKHGPYGIYLLTMLLKHCPHYLYIHAKRSFAEMKDWFITEFMSAIYHMFDTIGFDGSARGEAVELMANVFGHFSLPADFISDYKDDKTDFHTASIAFAIMTFSGEIWTFLTNTFKQLGRMVTQFDFKPGDKIAIAGDDFTSLRRPPIHQDWWMWQKFEFGELKYDAKPVGDFCSYMIHNGHLYKLPSLLWRRLKAHEEMGNLDNVVLGYFEMFTQLYNVGDMLTAQLPEKELDAVSLLQNFFFNIRRITGKNYTLPWNKVAAAQDDLKYGEESEIVELLNDNITLEDIDANFAPKTSYTEAVVDTFQAITNGNTRFDFYPADFA